MTEAPDSDYFTCCGAPIDMGHMDGCRSNPEREQRRWYLCSVGETVVEVVEPDWSRVPEAKREAVRAKWLHANARESVQVCYLWGEQLTFFRSQYSVTVLPEEVS